jgi:hypothetical protein
MARAKDKSTTATDEEEGPRSFGVFLTQVDDGQALIVLSQEQHDLLIALSTEADRTQSPAKGKLTLSLEYTVEPSGVTAVKYGVATKEPSPVRGGSMFWLSKGSNLTVENPRQKQLPFEVKATIEAREVAEKAPPRGV